MARAAGRAPQVRLMDVSELNPVVEDYRSPRLAVMMFYYFLMGISERLNTKSMRNNKKILLFYFVRPTTKNVRKNF